MFAVACPKSSRFRAGLSCAVGGVIFLFWLLFPSGEMAPAACRPGNGFRHIGERQGGFPRLPGENDKRDDGGRLPDSQDRGRGHFPFSSFPQSSMRWVEFERVTICLLPSLSIAGISSTPYSWKTAFPLSGKTWMME